MPKHYTEATVQVGFVMQAGNDYDQGVTIRAIRTADRRVMFDLRFSRAQLGDLLSSREIGSAVITYGDAEGWHPTEEGS